MERKRVIIRCMIWMLTWVLLVESQANARPLSFNVRENKGYDLVKLPDSLKQSNVVFLPDSLIRDTLQYEYSKIKEVAYRLISILYKRRIARIVTNLTKERPSMIFT